MIVSTQVDCLLLSDSRKQSLFSSNDGRQPCFPVFTLAIISVVEEFDSQSLPCWKLVVLKGKMYGYEISYLPCFPTLLVVTENLFERFSKKCDFPFKD